MNLHLKLRQEDYEFQVTQGYTVRSFSQKNRPNHHQQQNYPAYYLNVSQDITLRKAKWVLYGGRVPILLQWLMRKILQEKV